MLTSVERFILTGIEWVGGTIVVVVVLVAFWIWRVSRHRGGWEG